MIISRENLKEEFKSSRYRYKYYKFLCNSFYRTKLSLITEYSGYLVFPLTNINSKNKNLTKKGNLLSG